jgi:hypothetical protein
VPRCDERRRRCVWARQFVKAFSVVPVCWEVAAKKKAALKTLVIRDMRPAGITLFARLRKRQENQADNCDFPMDGFGDFRKLGLPACRMLSLRCVAGGIWRCAMGRHDGRAGICS